MTLKWLAICLTLFLTISACAVAPPTITTPTFTPTIASLTPTTFPLRPGNSIPGWQFYTNDIYGFELGYPEGSAQVEAPDKQSAVITFPIPPDTNLVEEYTTITVQQDQNECIDPLAQGREPGQIETHEVEFNGITFIKQSFSGVAVGTFTTWVTYTTQKEGVCVSIGSVLSTFDPDNLDPTIFPNPPKRIDLEEQLKLFETIASTFHWLQ